MDFQSGCCDRASKLRGDLRSWMPLSQVLQFGDFVCRPAAEGGIGHVLLQTIVPRRKHEIQERFQWPGPKKDQPEMDKAGQVREVSYETIGRTWNIDPGSVRFAG